jgi:tRNA(Arg) A34 adenosine deaminase TadA
MLRHLRTANAIARQAVENGRHPFGALLVAADNESVLLAQGNLDSVDHAEAVLARAAAQRYDARTLWDSTPVTTVEPCAMCSTGRTSVALCTA